MQHLSPPIALSIAGSDCSAGAGVQADLKTFAAWGVYGLTVVTAVVAEVPGHVISIHALPCKTVCDQLKALFKAFPIAAIKTGMLYTAEVIEAVAEVCEEHPRVPLVVDPVMTASSGDALLLQTSGDPLHPPDCVGLYRDCLFPLATLVTPNLDEAGVLLGGASIHTAAAMRAAGAELCGTHGVAFLMKGGHLIGEDAVDVLCLPGGISREFRAPHTPGVSTHGTGCTYSAAITAGLAQGLELTDAVSRAKLYVTAAITQSFRWEHDPLAVQALNHRPEPAQRRP